MTPCSWRKTGDLVGYLNLWGDGVPVTHIQQMAFVRPTMWGCGLSTYCALVRREPSLRYIAQVVHRPSPCASPAGRPTRPPNALSASLGYRYVRTFHVLRKELDQPIPAREFSDGIVLRTFGKERDARSVHAALTEAFADHWSQDVDSFERWERGHIEGEASEFDAGLCSSLLKVTTSLAPSAVGRALLSRRMPGLFSSSASAGPGVAEEPGERCSLPPSTR
jgi:hypothetical protein